MAADNPTFYADLDEPQSLNKYQYCYNNPLAYVDPDGHSVWTKLVKAIVKTVKTGSAVEAFRDNINDIKTVADSKQSGWRRVGAAASVASELLPVSVGDVKDGVGLLRSGIKRFSRSGDDAVDAAKNVGRTGKQARLKEIANDDKASSADRGWIKQEMNQIQRGKRKNIRNPPGKDLAHERGREAAKGFGYKHSRLQDRRLYKLQHKYDNYGRKNKKRPVDE